MKRNRFRWIIAHLLDKNPDYCWAELVMWALGYKCKFSDIFYRNNFIQHCKQGSEGYPYAYCNKCELNGNFYKNKQ